MKKLIFIMGAFTFILQISSAQVTRRTTNRINPFQGNYKVFKNRLQSGTIFHIKNGKLFGWGSNGHGQFGLGYAPGSPGYFRRRQVTSDSNWAQGMVLGHVMMIKTNGTLWGWGWNTFYQQGAPTTTLPGHNQLFPRQIGSEKNWIALDGLVNTLAIKSNGILWATGFGLLGLGDTLPRQSFTFIPNHKNWIGIIIGNKFSYGLKANGSLWGWGNNAYLELGLGDRIRRLSPTQIGNENSWIQTAISATSTSYGLKANGTLWAWGDGYYGQLGHDTLFPDSLGRPTQVGLDSNWIDVKGSAQRVFALKTNGTLWAWGRNSGILGDSTNEDSNKPIQIKSTIPWTVIHPNTQTIFGLKANGTLWSWGKNLVWQLGDNLPVSARRNYPLQVDKHTEWITLKAGLGVSYGLQSDGKIYAWGANLFGQLGNGGNTSSSIPLAIDTTKLWIGITAGGGHALALGANGTLWAWGLNSNGELGSGNTNNQNTPQQIGQNDDWATLAAGRAHSFGIKASGSLWAWGANDKGQLGTGNNQNKTSPFRIDDRRNWTVVEASESDHSLALQANGTLWAWGNNNKGQLGDGSTVNKNIPVQVGIENNWIAFSPGVEYSMGLRADGTLWAWGRNDFGQLGDGTIIDRFVPVQIGNDSSWIHFGAGGFNSFGQKSDGTHWAWGKNEGQFGNDTLSDTAAVNPIQIGNEDNWVQLSISPTHKLALNASRKRHCASGNNSSGELGDGTFVNRDGFVCNFSTITALEEKHKGQLKTLIRVYPNPGNGIFTIESARGGHFQIINELGQTIQNLELDFNGLIYAKTIQLKSKGIFILRSIDSQIKSQKLVVW